MDMIKVLADLRDYKIQLDAAIASLDRFARQRGEKRGRPLKLTDQLTDEIEAAPVPVKRGRRKKKKAPAKKAG
jgi:hypothetical protein